MLRAAILVGIPAAGSCGTNQNATRWPVASFGETVIDAERLSPGTQLKPVEVRGFKA